MSRLLYFVLLLAIAVHSQDDEDNMSDAGGRPRVAWVPIVSRNVTAAVGKVLDEEKGDEKLERIGKMLESSYDKTSRDVIEGDEKMRELEMRENKNQPAGYCIAMVTAVAVRMMMS